MIDVVRAGFTEVELESAEPMLVPLMSGRQKLLFYAGTAVWMVSLVYFWAWWLQPAHNFGTVRYIALSLLLAWIMLMPLYFVAVLFNDKQPNPTK